MPEEFGNWNSTYKRFAHRSDAGVWPTRLMMDADTVLKKIAESGEKVFIPLKRNRKQPREFDAEHYKNRNLVERFFCRIKQFRCITAWHEKLASRYSAFVALTTNFIWLT